MIKKYVSLLIGLLFVVSNELLLADEFNLESAYNKGMYRIEIDNDVVWNKDSNFTSGWSLQYHTACYAAWKDTLAPLGLKWVGNNFSTLSDDDSIVRFSHGIGQNMITPGDLTNPNPPQGDLPYAGTLTYSLNWQSFNRRTASIFQVTGGILGSESFAKEVQKFIHKDLGRGEDPQGWDTQRDTEPILNIAYAHIFRMAHVGNYVNDWAGQMFGGPMVYFGNLVTGVDAAIGFRLGWNIQEGFNSLPAPPGYGFFMNTLLPKPATASPHSVELVLACKAFRMIYSVLFDGSIITDDDRDVEREDFTFAAMAGLNYHYYDCFSIRLAIVHETDLLSESSLPQTQFGRDKTATDNSYGALMIDFAF